MADARGKRSDQAAATPPSKAKKQRTLESRHVKRESATVRVKMRINREFEFMQWRKLDWGVEEIETEPELAFFSAEKT